MISRASKSSILQGFAKSRSMLAGNTAYDPAATFLIERVTVGAGGAANVTFSSIPSTYKHLQIRAISRESTGGFGQGYLQFNSDTGNNYATHNLNGNGSSVGAGATASTSKISIAAIPGPNQSSNIFGATVIDILDYTNTSKYKTTRAFAGTDANGSGYVWLSSGVWQNTNAVSTISIVTDNASNWAQYTTFALYGFTG